jgi:probable addiction module antidote protein
VSERHKKYRDNPELISKHLNEALAADNAAVFASAVGTVMRDQNVLALSEETGLRRENLYRMFTGARDPTIGNTMKMLAGLGVQFIVKPRASSKPKPARPKRGRPRSKSNDERP